MNLPETFNAATYFVDRNVDEGRGASIAIECGGERVTYAQVAERVKTDDMLKPGGTLQRMLRAAEV